MFKFPFVLFVSVLLGTTPGMAAKSPSPSPSGAPDFDCDEESETCTCYLQRGSEDCRRMLDTGRCQAPADIGRPWTGEYDARRDGFAWIDYVDCSFTKGKCTCGLVTGPSDQGTAMKDEALTEGTVTGPQATQPDAVAPGPQGGEFQAADGTSSTPVSGEEEARTKKDAPARRGKSPDSQRKMATDPSEAAPVTLRLVAPSGLAVVREARTTLRLAWQDNSTREFGVEVYRMDPVKARAAGVASWEFVGTFDERNQSNAKGTGRRSGEDFGLEPGTHYCYRLRAYRGFDRAEVSDYSAVACGLTAR